MISFHIEGDIPTNIKQSSQENNYHIPLSIAVSDSKVIFTQGNIFSIELMGKI